MPVVNINIPHKKNTFAHSEHPVSLPIFKLGFRYGSFSSIAPLSEVTYKLKIYFFLPHHLTQAQE